MPLTKIQSLGITDGTIVNADINASAAIASTKLSGVTSEVKAWVNFNGTGTVAIRGSFNVSSITDNGVGDYTVNFTTAMSDTNYAVVAMTGGFNSGNAPIGFYESVGTARTASLVRLFSSQGLSAVDGDKESVAIFR